jgi:mono/diheme cytochrome c family protein
VQRRGRDIAVPRLDDEALALRGLGHFREHCVQCHGAPGVAPEPFALGMVPHAASLSEASRHWTPGELFWLIKNGLKMTGMPAWEFRMPDEDIWSIVAFLQALPRHTPQQSRALQPPAHGHGENPGEAPEPDPKRGKTALLHYACGTCHSIPGVVGADTHVGPPLDRMGTRKFIAGLLPNTPENMVRWLRQPQQLDRHTAMPDLGVTERDARDMAAYLDTLR